MSTVAPGAKPLPVMVINVSPPTGPFDGVLPDNEMAVVLAEKK